MGRVAMLAKHYDAIPDENDVEEQTRPFQSPRGGRDASSSSANTKSSANNIVSSFAMGCAVSLAAFGVASTALSSSSFTSSSGGGSSATMMMTKGGGKGGSYGADAEHFSYPLNSDRRTYKGKSNEVYFNGQKYEKSKWKNGLIDTESVPYETTNWVTTHPKVRAMMSASLGEARVQELPQLGKSNKKSSSKKKREEEEALDFDIPDGSKLPEHVEPVETSSSGGMASTKKVHGKVVTLDENGNINTAPMGRTTVDNYRMSWATEHVVFTNGDYSANYIPMKERDWQKKFKQIPGQGLTKPKDSMMTVDDAGTLIGRRKMPASQLGEVEKDDNDNEIVAHNKKKEEKSNKHGGASPSSSKKSHHHG